MARLPKNALYHREPWLMEDDMNLMEMLAEGRSWDFVSVTLLRSVSACKTRYSKLRYVKRVACRIGLIDRIVEKVELKPLKNR